MISAVSFPYQTNVVSKELFEAHLKLYHGYVEKVNETNVILQKDGNPQNANATYSKFRGLKKGQTFALDGVIFHEAYFQNIETSQTKMGEHTKMLLEQAFGTIANWQEDFVATAKSARGWCVTVFEQRTNRMANCVMDAHDKGVVCMAYPLLVLDMYEHAYWLDYKNDKSAYIEKFMKNINWDVVEARAKKLLFAGML